MTNLSSHLTFARLGEKWQRVRRNHRSTAELEVMPAKRAAPSRSDPAYAKAAGAAGA